MPEIRILPDRVANQIAAGEVVERPAAVVKELLENSLDAGATRVTVEFRHGGKSFIAIEDNGCGMTPDQALMALERHATSKIRETTDLDVIGTFGFRGEAVPSVASVSRFTLRTRPAEAVAGCEILENAGRLVHQHDVGKAQGKRIEVANLFAPVPARLKFLKSDNTESAHITRLVRLYAVAHPEVGFTLWEDGREIFRSPPAGDLIGRVRGIWGRQTAEELFVMPEARAEGMRLRGLLGNPGVGRQTRADMVTVINGRPVDSRVMAYALAESYHTFIPKGRFPLAFLFLDMDPSLVDVNVHPAKREVRFRDEPAVRRLIIESVLAALGGGSVSAAPEPAAPEPAEAGPEETPGAESPVAVIEPASRGGSGLPDPEVRRAAPVVIPARVPVSVPVRASASFPRDAAPVAAASAAVSVSPVSTPKVTPAPGAKPDWRLVGRLSDSTALFETAAGLLVLSLRAAHERIVYERVLRRFESHEVVSQGLLLPHALEFEPVAAAALRERAELLRESGFEVDEFGRNFFRLTAVPDWLDESDAETVLRDLVSSLARRDGDWRRDSLAHESLARLASSRAVRAADRVPDAAIPALLRDLFACRQPAVCPRGKKVFFELPHSELERRFGGL